MTLFDPCHQWEPCIKAFKDMDLEAQFETGWGFKAFCFFWVLLLEEHLYNLYKLSPASLLEITSQELCKDLQSMVNTFKVRKSDAPFILVLSHVLKSFSENLQDWWKALREACKENTVLVLVLESTEVSEFIPHLLLGDQKPTTGKFPRDSSSGSFGGAFVWNAKIPMPLMHSPTAKINPSRDLDMQSMPAAVPTPAVGHVHKSTASPQLWPPLRSESQHPVAPTGPHCKNCRSPMEIKINRKGFNPGSKFWGCTQYPRCKGPTRPA